MELNERFRKVSTKAANALGSPWLFVLSLVLIIVWLLTGPLAHFSDTWQLLINTSTTIFTFLAVFLIQNTQNRDAKAVHLKLDELIHAVRGARNQLVDLEDLSDAELEKLHSQFRKLHDDALAGTDDEEQVEDSDEDEESDVRHKPQTKRRSVKNKKNKLAK